MAGTTANLTQHVLQEIATGEAFRTEGSGPPPHAGDSVPLDVTTWIERSRDVADFVLTRDLYSGARLGSPDPGRARISLREGNLTLTGTSTGAGILIVTGDLFLVGGSRFDGLVIVLGSVTMAGGAVVRGSLALGPGATVLRDIGNSEVRYSSEALAQVTSLQGLYVAEAWQEASR
jgi:hypothetical protein